MVTHRETSPAGVEYNRVKSALEELGRAVIDQLRALHLALINNDPAELRKIAARDRDIDEKELRLDQMTRGFMELRAPLGPDFRYMLAAIDIARNLERIGDCVEYVARHASENDKMPDDFPAAWDLLTRMGGKCLSILEAAHRCWLDGDAESARRLPDQDDFVDAMQADVYGAVIASVRNGKVDVELGMVAMLMCNKLESIADIACHIAEQVVFVLLAQQIRHAKPKGE